jgi:hypothetical protein
VFFNLNGLFIHVLPQTVNSFYRFSSFLKKYNAMVIKSFESLVAKDVFFSNHNHTPYDEFFISDDEADYATQASDYLLESGESGDIEQFESSDTEDLQPDNPDGAFSYAEIYEDANLPSYWSSHHDMEFPNNFYLDIPQHSPLLDRRIAPDVFDDSIHSEVGLEYYFLLFYIVNLSPFDWFSRDRFLVQTTDFKWISDFGSTRLHQRQDVHDLEVEAQTSPGLLIFDKMGLDVGNTELTNTSLANLTSLASHYQANLYRSGDDSSKLSLTSQIFKNLRRAGLGIIPPTVFSQMSRSDWMELTRFVASLSSSKAYEDPNTKILPLTPDQIQQIWETFSNQLENSPDQIAKRLEHVTRVPKIFEDTLVYASGFGLGRPLFRSVLVSIFYFLFGSQYKSASLYLFFSRLDSSFSDFLYASRWTLFGDARLLRILNLYFSGFLSKTDFADYINRIPHSPASILAISSYLRHLASVDFERFRKLSAQLSSAGPIFNLVVLSLSDLAGPIAPR